MFSISIAELYSTRAPTASALLRPEASDALAGPVVPRHCWLARATFDTIFYIANDMFLGVRLKCDP
eukprot:3436740-Prorocentrum_lima.AAC.1